MNEPNATDRMNANQFDDEGLPGIDKNFPPEHSWGVEDPALVNGGSETMDDLATRVSRENDQIPTTPVVMAPQSGDPAIGDNTDSEKQLLGMEGNPDPDAALSPEEAAMHIEQA